IIPVLDQDQVLVIPAKAVVYSPAVKETRPDAVTERQLLDRPNPPLPRRGPRVINHGKVRIDQVNRRVGPEEGRHFPERSGPVAIVIGGPGKEFTPGPGKTDV